MQEAHLLYLMRVFMENPAEVYASCPSGYKVFLSGQMTGHGKSRGASMMPFFFDDNSICYECIQNNNV